MSSHAWADATNILAVRLDGMGDVLMTTPALRALKEGQPGRRLTLLTSTAGAEVARHVPQIDDVIVYEAPWVKSTPPRTNRAVDLEMVGRLPEARFDAAVIFTVFSQNPLPAAMLCYLANIPLRLAHCRENPYQLLTDWVLETEPETPRHEVQRQLDLVGGAGCTTADTRLSFTVPERAKQAVEELLGARGGSRGPLVVMHAGATAPSRRYPLSRFGEVARRLTSEMGARVVLTGSCGEASRARELQAHAGAGAVCLAGQLDLAELGALLQRADLLISNNTGPVHLAAALGTPVVDLYALTNLQHTPWNVPSRVLSADVPCKECRKSVCPAGHHACLRLVWPDAVVDAAGELLGGAA